MRRFLGRWRAVRVTAQRSFSASTDVVDRICNQAIILARSTFTKMSLGQEHTSSWVAARSVKSFEAMASRCKA